MLDYRSEKRRRGVKQGQGWLSGGMLAGLWLLSKAVGDITAQCTWTRNLTKSKVSQNLKRGTFCDPTAPLV